MPDDNPFLAEPLDPVRYLGRQMDRKKAKRAGFTKRSVNRAETWLGTFKTATESGHSDRIVVGVYVQVDGEGLIRNLYGEIRLLSISLMGEGRTEVLGDALFGPDRSIAYGLVDSILYPQPTGALTPASGPGLHPDHVAALVAAIMAVNAYGVERVCGLLPAFRKVGLLDPPNIIKADIAEVMASLHLAGYHRGMLAEMMAGRLISLMKAIANRELDSLNDLVFRAEQKQAEALLVRIKGIGPKVASDAWALMTAKSLFV